MPVATAQETDTRYAEERALIENLQARYPGLGGSAGKSGEVSSRCRPMRD